jgi:hypothetical protein
MISDFRFYLRTLYLAGAWQAGISDWLLSQLSVILLTLESPGILMMLKNK